MKRPATNSAKQLLAAAVANPFDYETVHTWLECLSRKFPLWSWQAEAYVELQRRAKSAAVGRYKSQAEYDQAESQWYKKGGILKPGKILPSAYPGTALLESILKDDGVLDEFDEVLSGLEWAIHLRRAWLTDHRRSAENPLCPQDWNSERRYEQPMFWYELQDDALRAEGYDPDDRRSFDILEFIGRELVRAVAAWISAPNKKERDKRRKELEGWENGIAVELVVEQVGQRSGQQKGPRADILKGLVNEGRKLLDLCWDLFPVTVSRETRAALTLQGIQDPADQQVWVARLALPILSSPELLALRDERQVREGWKPHTGPRPTAKRLAVWILAHRLGLYAHSLHRKACNHDDNRYFENRPNPVTKHLWQPPEKLSSLHTTPHT